LMDDDAKPAYVIDTSVWLTLRTVMAVPGMWGRLNALMTDGRIVIPREVVDEVGLHGDTLDQWIHDHKGSHRPTEDVWDLATDIANQFPDLVDIRKKFDADSFVIATAIAEKAARATGMFPCEVYVITNERRKLPGKVAIPDACDALKVRCRDLTGWFELEDWGV
jgi:hypothetical protein